MIAKCKDITKKINDLENRVNKFSKPKLSFCEETKRSITPYESTQAHSRVKISQHMVSQMQKQINKEMTGDCTSDLLRFGKGIKCNAEKESDAAEIAVEKINSIIPFKNSQTTKQRAFCGGLMKNPPDEKKANVEEITELGMMSNIPSKWPIISHSDNPPPKVVLPPGNDQKIMDNSLIDSLRGEIEKVRHRLYAIGTHPCENSQRNPYLLEQKEADSPSGDHDYRSELLKVIKELQMKNDELNEQLEYYKKNQENSMRETEKTANLLKTYENKVKTLQEQTLKSSRIMAHSKDKFCNILLSRNGQIKNLFDINQQLKKIMLTNEEQMNKLNNNHKLLKENYKELEKSDKRNREENYKYRETMTTLKKELKYVYEECSMLRQENIRFFEELNNTKKDIIRKYASKMDEHESHCQSISSKIVEGESNQIKEVPHASENIRVQGNELENLRSEVEDETQELQSKYKKLAYQYEALMRNFREYEQFDEIKCSCIEQELKEFSMKMKEKEGIILRERDDLRTLVEELVKAIKRNKTAIRELSSTNERQENVIENLNKIIRVKNDQLLKYHEEVEQVTIRYENSQNENDNLKRALNEIKGKSWPEHEDLEQELQHSREIINKEKDNNLIKQKIIQDHEVTINELKKIVNDKSNQIESKNVSLCKLRNEVDRFLEELEYSKLGLEKEKKEKLRILNELQSIKTYKETLIAQISDLENTIKNRCRDDEINQIDLKKTIDKLQKHMRQQEKEWEAQRRKLQKDKEKALHAAKFASQKLLDTVNDFRKQMCQQKDAQTKLAMLLQGKEQQLESLTMKVRSILPSQKESEKYSLDDRSHQIISSSFCQIKQLNPGSQQMYNSEKSIEDEESKDFSGESYSCVAHCD